jgi:hypothetical protein
LPITRFVLVATVAIILVVGIVPDRLVRFTSQARTDPGVSIGAFAVGAGVGHLPGLPDSSALTPQQ